MAELDRPAPEVARALIGAGLYRDGVGGRIVETEAYTRDDPASHSHRGPTRRNRVMFGPAGRLYVYRIYGLHLCANIVCGPEGSGQAVLIRALEPLAGLERMAERRGPVPLRQLAAGPGRLAQALGITAKDDGADLALAPWRLEPARGSAPVVIGPRIGISRAVEQPWRFGLQGSSFLSRPFR